ncbi:MAG: class I SAM-dependent methyltransferase [Marmoricola sp.]
MTLLAESFTDVYSAALRGEHCHVIGSAGTARLPVENWTRPADDADRVVLGHCDGPTLDVGCGPGRMAEHLTRSGTAALGIDVVAEAVQQARARGVAALERDVFEHLPGEGRWSTVLLADGNVGIGGDPRRLLQRSAQVLAPGGRIVVDLAPPGTGVETRMLRLRTRSAQSQPFAWSTVAADRIGVTAAGLGLLVGFLGEVQDRWFAVLTKDAR